MICILRERKQRYRHDKENGAKTNEKDCYRDFVGGFLALGALRRRSLRLSPLYFGAAAGPVLVKKSNRT